nr:HAMP domain-containing histidine kinase [Lachnospiraceae bacterium]
MIKKLRAKIIAISMLSVVLILLIIMGSINIINYRNIVSNADNVLKMLEENDGQFPMDRRFGERDDNMPGGSMAPDESATPSDGNSDDGNAPQGMGPNNSMNPNEMPPEEGINSDNENKGFLSIFSTQDSRREARYFTVKLDKDGNVTEFDISQVASVNESTAKELASKLYEKTGKNRFYKKYRYKSIKENGSYMVIFLDCSSQLENQRSFLITSLLVSAVGLVTIFVLLIFFSNWVVKPVDESFEKQKRFITDAGHEIKTPLATIKADAAVIEFDLDENSDSREWIDDIKVQIERLTGLTNDLIYLSKMDESRETLSKYDFVISDTAKEVSKGFESRAKLEKKTYKVDVEPLLTYKGEEKAIYELLSILLDNAVKYSDENGRIDFSLKKRGKNIVIKVYNTTGNISEKHIKHLFDRFYRTDESRNSKKGGYGIGLSKA